MNGFITRRDFSLLACGAVLARQAHADTRPRATWRLATGYSDKSFHTINIAAMARDVAAATQGRLEIQLHSNNTLAKLNEVRAAVESGRAEAGETIMSSLVGEIPIAGAD